MSHYSFHRRESSRDSTDRYFVIAVPRDTREGRFSLGVRARARDRKLLCRSQDRDRILRLRMQCTEQPSRTEAK